MIEIKNISKTFKENTVINNLSLTAKSSQITALVGKNGSGKTTLMRLISGLLKPDSGTILCDRKNLGILIGGDVNLYENLTGYENLKYFAFLHNMSKKDFCSRYYELNEILKFNDFINERTSLYSRGMKQKIAFASAIIHNPNTILLDEPSTGLDILTASDVISFIKYCKDNSKTILISTHNISEIADLSDNIAILSSKKIILQSNSNDFFADCKKEEKLIKLRNILGDEKIEQNIV